MTTLHRRLADSATVSAALPTAPPDASKDLEGSRFFTSAAGTAISPNNFRTKVWLPAPERPRSTGRSPSAICAAHASWLLAGGADFQVVKGSLGHRQITTTQQ